MVELADGRIVVADDREPRLVLLDFDRQQSVDLARMGGGPREFRTIGGLVPDGHGGAFAVDFAQHRVLPITATARVDEVRRYPTGLGVVRGADSAGRLYGAAFLPRGNRRRLPDSMQVVRWDPLRGSLDTLFRYDGGLSKWVVPAGAPLPVEGAVDRWVVLPDGMVVLVEAATYRLRYFDGGRQVRTRVVPWTPVPFTDADREAYLADQAETPRRSIGSAGDSPRGAPAPPRWVFPDHHPVFVDEALRADGAGRVWIARADHLGEEDGTRYDVIDAEGRLVGRVVVPGEGQLVGVGAKAIYVAATDPDDGELRVVRYRSPLPFGG